VRRNELTIVVSLAAVAAIIGFWLLVLSPKRDEASALKDDVSQLRSQVDEAQQSLAAGEQARRSFPVDYRKLVVLGKAVPADGDQASLLVQLQQLANRSGVTFQSIDLTGSTSSASAAPATAPSTSSSTTTTSSSSTNSSSTDSTNTDTSSTDSSSTTTPSTSTTTSTTATATEASAAILPIGASIGPAGLPVMPYDLTFTGGFFQIADFMKGLNAMVGLRHGTVDVRGRLITVDAFNLAPVQTETQGLSPVPTLTVDLAVTTYLTPADQGILAGASPSGPAPSTSSPVSTTAPTTDSTSTSTSAPSATPSTTPTP
jgi:Tfp pilus assembly protein PilO